MVGQRDGTAEAGSRKPPPQKLVRDRASALGGRDMTRTLSPSEANHGGTNLI